MVENTKFIDKNKNVVHLEGVQALKKLGEMLTEPIPGPKHFAQAIQYWRFIVAFGMNAIAENQFLPLVRCWDAMRTQFGKNFDDGVFLEACVLADFRFGPEQKSFIERFDAVIGNQPDCQPVRDFADKFAKTRLGLYQITSATKNRVLLKELFTGRAVSVMNTVDQFGAGEIWLVRLLEVEGDTMIFGDPKGWPASYLGHIEDMVRDKMFIYGFDTGQFHKGARPSEATGYEGFMKITGPYWMSIVASDDPNDEILAPDYFKQIQ